MASINAEFSRGTDLNSYRGTGWYIDAGGSGTFPSGSIDFDIFRGKRLTAPLFSATINSNQQELNLRVWALNNGWNGSTPAVITVGSGVYIWSDNTGAAAMAIDGSWPGGVTLINNGFIIGRGGNGGGLSISVQNGGPAIVLGVNVTIQNNSYIAGGGGGGGLGYGNFGPYEGGGGGAGGGNGGAVSGTAGGAGGSVGNVGSNGTNYNNFGATGGGGGRQLPGTGASGVSAGGIAVSGLGGGAGGSGGGYNLNAVSGAGGSAGNTGGTSATTTGVAGGGGGGWGASGGFGKNTSNNAGSPGLGGAAVNLNGFSVTWTAFGTRYGAVA
jgi:hypothetical protein